MRFGDSGTVVRFIISNIVTNINYEFYYDYSEIIIIKVKLTNV